MNAICDAAGVQINSLPLSYEKVWRALREKQAVTEVEEPFSDNSVVDENHLPETEETVELG